jgi:hypothetical protein
MPMGMHSAARWERIKEGDGYIYVAEVIRLTFANVPIGSIKIGFSLDPAKRLQRFPNDVGVVGRLLGAFPATIHQEKTLHQRLRHLRIKNEFYPRSALMEAA